MLPLLRLKIDVPQLPRGRAERRIEAELPGAFVEQQHEHALLTS
jgi:hypothetical protein